LSTPVHESATSDAPTSAQKALSFLREVAETLLIAVIIFFLLQTVLKNFRITGDSMLPNFRDGQYLFVDKVTYRLSDPARGDVIVFRYPRDQKEDFIKRIIGLPGETVEIKDGLVYVNNVSLTEPYLHGQTTLDYATEKVTLGVDQYFVLGDNRNHSSDSRLWGPISRSNIIGRALLCYWPPGSWHLVPHPTY
jgi:signal peptidase I